MHFFSWRFKGSLVTKKPAPSISQHFTYVSWDRRQTLAILLLRRRLSSGGGGEGEASAVLRVQPGKTLWNQRSPEGNSQTIEQFDIFH